MVIRRHKLILVGLCIPGLWAAFVFINDYKILPYGNDDTVVRQKDVKFVYLRANISTQKQSSTPNLMATCEDLIQGKYSLESRNSRYINNINYEIETQNCSQFLNKRRYILGMTDEEAGFPLAFSILMYKHVEQTERLLRAIYRTSNYYCVHVDKNASMEVQNQMKSIVGCFPNVFLSSRQVAVEWGRYTVLEPELICMRDLLKKPGWKYFINLTGQEFPLKTNLQLVRILKILNGTNSVDADTRPKWKGQRWSRAWPPPHNIQPTKGSVHAVVSRNFVDFAMTNPKAQDFAEWLKNTTCPDESFFSTIDNDPNLYAAGASNVSGKPTDYIQKPFIARFKHLGHQRGERTFIFPCRGKIMRAICIFGVGDLNRLTLRRELFANKFYIDFQRTFECMEEWHRNRTLDEYRGKFDFNYEFYESLPQVRWSNGNSTVE